MVIFGFFVPNGAFIYFSVASPGTARAAISNPISVVLMAEAFFLMFLFAWLLKRAYIKRPTGLVFVIMSVVGSMAFSVPATIYLACRGNKLCPGKHE